MHTPGPGPATPAHRVVFAHTALPLVAGTIAELAEERGITPDFRKWRLPHVTAIFSKIAAGLHLPGVADEAETDAAQAASRQGVHAKSFRSDPYTFFFGFLAHDPVIVRCASGLEVHGGCFAEVVEPMQDFLIFLR